MHKKLKSKKIGSFEDFIKSIQMKRQEVNILSEAVEKKQKVAKFLSQQNLLQFSPYSHRYKLGSLE